MGRKRSRAVSKRAVVDAELAMLIERRLLGAAHRAFEPLFRQAGLERSVVRQAAREYRAMVQDSLLLVQLRPVSGRVSALQSRNAVRAAVRDQSWDDGVLNGVPLEAHALSVVGDTLKRYGMPMGRSAPFAQKLYKLVRRRYNDGISFAELREVAEWSLKHPFANGQRRSLAVVWGAHCVELLAAMRENAGREPRKRVAPQTGDATHATARKAQVEARVAQLIADRRKRLAGEAE